MISARDDTYLSTREKIMHYLLKHSSPNQHRYCTVKKMAKELDISENGVRQHLSILEKEDLVTRGILHDESPDDSNKRTGRPAIVYYLNENALDHFPKDYANFAVNLLAEVEKEFGQDALVKVLKNVGKKIAADIRKAFNIPEEVKSPEELKDQIKIVKHILDIYGKYPLLEETEDSFLIRSFNCLVYGVVKEVPHVCRVDETIMAELLTFKPVKEKCLMQGDGYCQYRIMKP
ncbi:MAG: helix-turn-helix transcriptional regulator [Candidatus Odinarchaeota archaeon]